MARAHRLALLFALAGVPTLGVAGFACDTDAVGVETCRTIESRRCEVAPTCAAKERWAREVRTEDEVQNCKTFYLDHCLNGIENPSGDPSTDKTDACVAAISKVAQCEKDGVVDVATCGEPSQEPALTPCAALGRVEVLDACAFLAAPGSTTASTSTATTASAASTTTDASTTADASSSDASSSSGMGGGGQ